MSLRLRPIIRSTYTATTLLPHATRLLRSTIESLRSPSSARAFSNALRTKVGAGDRREAHGGQISVACISTGATEEWEGGVVLRMIEERSSVCTIE